MSATVLAVTGTDTGVGKTIVAAAICAAAAARGGRAAYIKAAQTGVEPGQPSDADVIRRLAAPLAAAEGARYRPPLAPGAAIRLGSRPAVPMSRVADQAGALAASVDLVVIEGAGGVLVELDDRGTTIVDLAASTEAALVIVARPDLGTLNHTALTCEAATARGLPVVGVVIGSWPDEPDLACRSNLSELRRLVGKPIAGAIPEGAGEMTRDQFVRLAPGWLGRELGGAFDGSYFEHRFAPRLTARLRGTSDDD